MGSRIPAAPLPGLFHVFTNQAQAQTTFDAVNAKLGYPQPCDNSFLVTPYYAPIEVHPTGAKWAYPNAAVVSAGVVPPNVPITLDVSWVPPAAALTKPPTVLGNIASFFRKVGAFIASPFKKS